MVFLLQFARHTSSPCSPPRGGASRLRPPSCGGAPRLRLLSQGWVSRLRLPSLSGISCWLPSSHSGGSRFCPPYHCSAPRPALPFPWDPSASNSAVTSTSVVLTSLMPAVSPGVDRCGVCTRWCARTSADSAVLGSGLCYTHYAALTSQ